MQINYANGIIGQGKYGSIWKAKLKNETVAVKVFFSTLENSWSRETEIYKTCMLKHKNILGFIGSDKKANSYLIIITDFHSNGSLYDYLQVNLIEKSSILSRFLYSISNGLNHLHQDLINIAHRDLKTSNILVKLNFDCCLADFGQAVRYNNNKKLYPQLVEIKEGTIRYMPPECLSDKINVNSIDELKKGDIYQLGLVMWELLSSFKADKYDTKQNYSKPFSEYINDEPDILMMKDIVCIKKLRPKLRKFNSNVIYFKYNFIIL